MLGNSRDFMLRFATGDFLVLKNQRFMKRCVSKSNSVSTHQVETLNFRGPSMPRMEFSAILFHKWNTGVFDLYALGKRVVQKYIKNWSHLRICVCVCSNLQGHEKLVTFLDLCVSGEERVVEFQHFGTGHMKTATGLSQQL